MIFCFNLFTSDVLSLAGKFGTVYSSIMLGSSGTGDGCGTLAGKRSKGKRSSGN